MYFYAPEWEPSAPPPSAEPRPAESPAQGRLIMDLEPAEAEVFADGYYVGVLEDFSGARGGG